MEKNIEFLKKIFEDMWTCQNFFAVFINIHPYYYKNSKYDKKILTIASIISKLFCKLKIFLIFYWNFFILIKKLMPLNSNNGKFHLLNFVF